MKRILVMGSKKVGLDVLKTVHSLGLDMELHAMTFDDRDDCRTCLDEWCHYADNLETPCVISENPCDTADIVLKIQPDIVLVAGWYQWIDKSILQAIPLGFLGIHFSLLPKYRGGSPLVWSLINGETALGVSLFSFTTGLDEGDIWGQMKISVESSAYIGDVLPRLEAAAIELVKELLPSVLEQSRRPTPQDHGAMTYFPMRKPKDNRIDWSQTAERINRFVHALSHPYPGAYTEWNQRQRLIVWRSTLVNTPAKPDVAPGTIVACHGDEIEVICGDHCGLLLQNVEYIDREVSSLVTPPLATGQILQ